MSNKGKNRSKKWLITRLKTSGSKKRHVDSADYADERHSKVRKDWENLPLREGMGKSHKFFNNKVNYGLLVRFLRGKVGGHWPVIYDEIMERIPSNLSEYKDCVDWFVAQDVMQTEDGLWDKESQKFITVPREEMEFDMFEYNHKEFYVDPETQVLCKTEFSFKQHQTKDLDPDGLREFREEEQKEKLAVKRQKRTEKMDEEAFRNVLNKSKPKD